jgi:predicted 3-demethylubiquinone-9 3-methyltransferase (glyoxalase superfamily)
MQKIAPCLWFNDRAEEAVRFYTSAFPSSKSGTVARYGAAAAEASGREQGSVMTIAFQLAGQDFLALNGGPHFQFSPAVSLFVSCDSHGEIDSLWSKLSDGGMVLMDLAEYPFSPRFGWVQDKFGLSWQLKLASTPQKIRPCLMFVGDQAGNAEPAMQFYVSLFSDAAVIRTERYTKGEGDVEGRVKHGVFRLSGQEFIGMDSSIEHKFGFTGGVSFIVNCETQGELDTFWESFTQDGHADQCGWVTDKYGVFWQIVPAVLGELMREPDRAERVVEALLKMGKVDIAQLESAADG